MNDNQQPKANSQWGSHVHDKPSHMVHLNHQQLRQDQPIYAVVPEMEQHAFFVFPKRNCKKTIKSGVNFCMTKVINNEETQGNWKWT